MLEKSVRIGRTELCNRLVMAPVDLEKSDHGTVSDTLLEYYDERTKGGYVGLVIVEHSYVQPDGRATEHQLSAAKDDDIVGLTRLAKTVHDNGSRIIMQLSHAGLKAIKADDGLDGVSPSGTPESDIYAKCRPTHSMTPADIGLLIESFRQAALRTKAAGFDGVEIHGAHGYLLNQFYSPLTNHRTDSYGVQTMEGRVKLHRQVIAAVREVLGDEMILGIRFGACDYAEGGSTFEDGAEAARLLEHSGIDFIDISGGVCGSRLPDRTEPGYFAEASAAVKQAVSLPVILTGGVKTREDAENLLKNGLADLVGAARSIVADPAWAKKVLAE